MHCAACVRRVEKALGGVDGVREASVNLATEKATMVFDPAHTGLEAMKQAVEEAGYGLVEPEDSAGRRRDRGWHRDGSGSSQRGYRDSAPPGQGDVRGAARRELILLLSVAGAIPAIGDFAGRGLLIWRACYAGSVLGRLAILRRRLVGDTASEREYAHSDCSGHQRRLPV